MAGMPPRNVARMRRATFFVLVLLGTILGTWLLAVFLSANGLRWSKIGLMLVFVPLFYQLNGADRRLAAKPAHG